MLRLYTAGDLPEAHLVVQLLERVGIAAQVFNEHAQGGLGNCSLRCSTSAILGVVGEIPFTHTWPEVWVLEDADLQRAQQALDAWRRTPATPPRRCHDCGDDSRDGGGRAASGTTAEENPGTFETCWRCGHSLML